MNKYSMQQTGQYSRDLAKTLADRFFKDKTTITGPELMNFSPVKQINLLVVKELLGNWHREMARLKSPYFDFGAEPVKTSLAEFMNVLSQHILIKRNDFEPLAEKAVANTLLLATDASAFFEAAFLPEKEAVDLEKLRSYLRYLDYGRDFFTDFLSDLHLGNIERSFVLQRFKLYQNAHYKNELDTKNLLEELNNLLPLPAAAPVTSAQNSAAAAPEMPLPAQVTTSPTLVTPQAPIAKPAEPVIAPVTAQKPVAAPVPPIVAPSAPAPAAVSQPVDTPPKAPEPAVAKPKAPVTENAPSGLNDRFKTEHTSLNDKLRKPAVTTLADTMGASKIESLKNSISINQRFAFINELFGGDNQAYHAAINQLDQQPDQDSAKSFILEDLTNAYDWSNRGEHVAKLLRLVERKFA